jgi:hypothetical protein
MARRRLPKLDLCRIRPERFHRLSDDQLMKIWGRLGASAPSRTTANSLVKGIVSNLAAMKVAQRVHKDPTLRRDAVAGYRMIVRRLEGELKREQAKACGIRATEAAAQRAFDTNRPEEAKRLWQQVRRDKKRGRSR